MRQLGVMGLAAVLLVIGGCSVTIGGSGGGWEGSPRQDNTTIAEIDAAAGLSFDSAKERTFKNIASRSGLSGREQSYLINKSIRSLAFDSAKERIMLTLIANPGFLAEGKKAILDNLNHLAFDSAKERVLAAINKRGPVPSDNEVEIIIQQQPESVVIEPPVLPDNQIRNEL